MFPFTTNNNNVVSHNYIGTIKKGAMWLLFTE